MKHKKPVVIKHTHDLQRSNISRSAETDLPDIMFVRDNAQMLSHAIVETWDAECIPDNFAVAGKQIEIGMYQLVKVLKVNGLVKLMKSFQRRCNMGKTRTRRSRWYFER